MSDLFVQSGTNQGTTTAPVTLTGVVAGNTLVAFLGDGSSASPGTHTVSDGQGSYTAKSSASDGSNAVFLQVFVLENANAGSHTITGTTGAGDAAEIVVVEIGAGGAGSYSGDNAQFQTTLATTTDLMSSGSMTVTGPATLIGLTACSSSASAGDEATVGTGFTTRAALASALIGAWRLESKAVAANAAATWTAPNAGQNHVSLGIAILNGAGAAVASLGAVTQPGPGVSPSRQVQFRPLRQASAPANVTVALTGVAGTGAVGAVQPLQQGVGFVLRPGPGVNPFNNGQFIASPRGQSPSSPNVSVALTGVAGTGAVGTAAPSNSLPITGNAGTGAAGTVAPSRTVALTGVAGTGAAGTVAPALSIGLTGVAATGAVGNVSAGADVTLALTGVAATGSVGTVAPSSSVGVTGNAATAAVGTMPPGLALALLGSAGTGGAGTVAPQIVVSLGGVAATGAVGNVSTPGGATLTGNAAAGAAGSVGASLTLALTGVAATGSVGAVGITRASILSGVAAAGTVGTVTQTGGTGPASGQVRITMNMFL